MAYRRAITRELEEKEFLPIGERLGQGGVWEQGFKIPMIPIVSKRKEKGWGGRRRHKG